MRPKNVGILFTTVRPENSDISFGCKNFFLDIVRNTTQTLQRRSDAVKAMIRAIVLKLKYSFCLVRI